MILNFLSIYVERSVLFLVACYGTLHPALSVRLLVRLSVRPSVHFTFSALMGVLALLLLPKCSTDLNYGPCPPTRDWGSCVSGLVPTPCECFLPVVISFKFRSEENTSIDSESYMDILIGKRTD